MTEPQGIDLNCNRCTEDLSRDLNYLTRAATVWIVRQRELASKNGRLA
jgi:hypothetical protein